MRREIYHTHYSSAFASPVNGRKYSCSPVFWTFQNSLAPTDEKAHSRQETRRYILFTHGRRDAFDEKMQVKFPQSCHVNRA